MLYYKIVLNVLFQNRNYVIMRQNQMFLKWYDKIVGENCHLLIV